MTGGGAGAFGPVLFVSHTGRWRGAERSLVEVVTGLAARGVPVEVLVPERGRVLDELQAAGVPVQRAPFAWWAGVTPRSARRVRVVERAVRNVAALPIALLRLRARPAVVVTNSVATPFGALLARTLRVPHVWWVREYGVPEQSLWFDLGARRAWQIVARSSAHLLCASQSVQDHVRSVTGSRRPVTVVPPAVAVDERWRALDPPGQGDVLRIACVGTLMPSKGQDVLVEAVASMAAAGRKVELHLAGSGLPGFERSLSAMVDAAGAGDVVQLHGEVADAMPVIAASDVVVVPSQREAFGRVTVEAMKAGRAVVGTDAGGTPELVEHERTGLLVPPGEPSALRQALERLDDDRPLLRSLAAAGQARASERLGTEQAVEALLGVLAGVRPLTVLLDPAWQNEDENPYTALLAEALQREGVAVVEFDRRAARRASFDVWHQHWPHAHGHAARGGLLGGRAKAWLVLALMARARRRGARIVWTVHDDIPHDDTGRATSGLWTRLHRRLVDGVIVLGSQAPPADLAGRPVLHSRHGHFRERYEPPLPAPEARRRLGLPEQRTLMAFVGRVHPYKGVDDLVGALAASDVEADLLVAGRPDTAETEEGLRRAAATDERIHLALRWLHADEVVAAVSAADVVVLPYRRILNSGSAILALSLGRPVVVPAEGNLADLAGLVGHDWVRTFTGRLSAGTIADVVAWARRPRPPAPDLADLEWGPIARETAAFYQELRHGS